MGVRLILLAEEHEKIGTRGSRDASVPAAGKGGGIELFGNDDDLASAQFPIGWGSQYHEWTILCDMRLPQRPHLGLAEKS